MGADIGNIHALLADGLLADPAMAGRLRRMPAGITYSSYLPLEGRFQIGCVLKWKEFRPFLVPVDGFEPPTHALRIRSSISNYLF